MYGMLQILYAAGTASPDDIFNEQTVVIVVACSVKLDYDREYMPSILISGVFGMDWSALNLGDAGVKAVFERLEKFIESKRYRRKDKSDAGTTSEGRSYYTTRPANSMLSLDPGHPIAMSWPGSVSTPVLSIKINGIRYAHKHFAGSKPANRYREDLLKREQVRNGKHRSVEVTARLLVIEGLQGALEATSAGEGGGEQGVNGEAIRGETFGGEGDCEEVDVTDTDGTDDDMPNLE